MRTFILVFAVLAVAACATPEVAEDYEAKTFLTEELEAALASDDPTGRADAARQVEGMEPDRRMPLLLALSGDDRAPVRLMAIGLLTKHHAGDEAVAARLAEILSLDADSDIRTAAVSGLAAGGTARGLTALLDTLTEDPSLGVRQAAGAALDRITGQAFGRHLSEKVDAAEESAGDAAMSYDDWMEANRDALRWDAELSRFVIGE